MTDAEKKILIRCIRDYDPSLKATDLALKSMHELALIYKALRGY